MSIPPTCRVARISNHGNIEVAQTALRQPQKGELVIRVNCSVISPGTELQGLRNAKKDGEEIFREFGYQNAGVVIDANDCVGFKAGDRVACMGASYAQHSEWAVVPMHLAFKISEKVSFEEAAFANLLGTALHAVRRVQVQYGEYVAVVGLGIVGQLVCQLANWSGAHVIGIDRVAMRQQLALKLGAESVANFSDDAAQWKAEYTRSYGLDSGVVAFGGDASGVLHHLAQVMKTAPDTHAYGRIAIVGGAIVNVAFPTPFGNIDICASSRTGPGYHDKAWERGGEYPEALVPWNTRRNLEECYNFIEAGKLNVKPLITDRVTLDEVPSICRQLVEHPDEVLGVVVKYE